MAKCVESKLKTYQSVWRVGKDIAKCVESKLKT